MSQESGRGENQTIELIDSEINEPRRYAVLMHNDNYTRMDFVIDVLRRVFHKDFATARSIMMQVHNNGVAECGNYTREIAETKIARVISEARAAGFPLKCTMEER